jgi:hypothetical protein
MSETSEITGPLIKALNQTWGLAMRMNSGIAMRGKFRIRLHDKGTADILFFPRRGEYILSARPVWIETKQPKGHTNPEQVKAQAEFRERVEALGHRYIRATTIEEGLQVLK